MRRLWLSLLVIALLAVTALANVQYLERFTTELSERLAHAQNCAEAGEIDSALRLTSSARDCFLRHSFYLHVTLDHQEIDGIQSAFGETLEYLRLDEIDGVYFALNSELITKIGLLAEAEQLNLKNIL